MSALTLLFALVETISDTIKERKENRNALEKQRRYEYINWENIKSVTLDHTETAYRIEIEEEFDPVATYSLSKADGWPHYETTTVQYTVENGLNYCFTIRYKNGTEIYRKFHETSHLTERLLKYCNDNKYKVPLDSPVTSRFYEILNDSLKLMKTTTNPSTYFSRYKTALDNAKKLLETTSVPYYNDYASEIITDLTQNRSKKIKAFVDRCNKKGLLYSIKGAILSNEYAVPSDVKEYVQILLKKRENENINSNDSGEYIYCSVTFSPTGQTYYYKTDDETLRVGDVVIVTVGSQREKKTAKIKKIERFSAITAPYPPNKTKDIIGKY